MITNIFKDFLYNSGRLKKATISFFIIFVFIASNYVYASISGEGKNTAPVISISTDILHKEKLNIQILTDYTGQKLADMTSKLAQFRGDMYPKGVNVSFNLITSSVKLGTKKITEEVWIPSKSKTVTVSDSDTESQTYTYTASGWEFEYGSTTTYPPTKSYNSGGYSGTLSKSSDTHTSWSPSRPSNPSIGTSCTQKRTHSAEWSGKVTKPGYWSTTTTYVDYSTLDNSQIYIPSDDTVNNIFLYLSDGVGDDYTQPFGQYYSFGNLSKTFANSLVINNFNTYAITPMANFDYMLPDSTVQDMTIHELINCSVDKGSEYDSTIVSGKDYTQTGYAGIVNSCESYCQLDNFINDLSAKYQSADTPNSSYLLINEDTLIYNKNYDDFEKDMQGKNTIYAERWNYSQDPYYFENSMGVIGNNKTWSDWSTSLVNNMAFAKTGKYTISYQVEDNPTMDSLFANYNMESNISQFIVYACRRPIAQFSTSINGTNLSLQSMSYDPDHQSHTDSSKGILNGITKEVWKYKTIDSTDWTDGKLTMLLTGVTYIVSLSVLDEDGFYSIPYTKLIGFNAQNHAPVSDFTISYTQTYEGEPNWIIDASYDPDNDPLQYHWYVIDKATNTAVPGYDDKSNAPDISKLPKGNYTVRLIVNDIPLYETSLQSDPCNRDITILENPLTLTNFRITSMVNPPTEYSFPILISSMPANCKSGYRNCFAIDVSGQADSITVQVTDGDGNSFGTLNMIKQQDIDTSHSIWGCDYITDLTIPIGTLFNFHIIGYKNSTPTYDYNSKTGWGGNTLIIVGNALEDTKIYRRY